MIVVTGSNGFIGRNMVSTLKADGYEVHGVDDNADIAIEDFSNWWDDNADSVEWVIHLGAVTDTMVTDEKLVTCMNTNFTKIVWLQCLLDKVPLIYASSAAVYGNGHLGFEDDHKLTEDLVPLNLYAKSKHDFDCFAVKQSAAPTNWYGLRFFNVYGFDEHRKGKMASMISQGYDQISSTGKLKLFEGGLQRRDFVYVQDVVDVIMWLMMNKPKSGLYNVGTGQAETFNAMAEYLFDSMKVRKDVRYISIPYNLIPHYQEFTQADMTKLISAGYDKPFKTLKEGITEFIKIKDEDNNKPIQPEAKK
jgi:ADP-L-glycero-D-manno-heptose 6-epimerase